MVWRGGEDGQPRPEPGIQYKKLSVVSTLRSGRKGRNGKVFTGRTVMQSVINGSFTVPGNKRIPQHRRDSSELN